MNFLLLFAVEQLAQHRNVLMEKKYLQFSSVTFEYVLLEYRLFLM